MSALYQYIYGPVYSWRLGWSLGIDPVSRPEKICSYDCLYCQLGETSRLQTNRETFVPTQEIIDEIARMPSVPIDFFTFSGRGEPTLAANLGEMILALRRQRPEKIAIITNGGMLWQPDVRRDVQRADHVLVKLDAWDDASLKTIDRPSHDLNFAAIIDGIKTFRREFSGFFALQIMFIKENASFAHKIVELAEDLRPDEIQLNTPLRPGASTPLSESDMLEIKKQFLGLKSAIRMVYEEEQKAYSTLHDPSTVLRHGNFKKEIKNS